MTEWLCRSDSITNRLLELFGIGKAANDGAIEQHLSVETHLEHPRFAGDQCHLTQFLGEGREQLLSDPGSSG